MKFFITAAFLLFVSITNAQNSFSIPKPIQNWINKELAKAPNKTLMKDFNKGKFFAPQKSQIIGYLKGYNANATYTTGMIYADNELTRESHPIVVKINKNGSFEAAFTLAYPATLNIEIADLWISFYLEPGQTLALMIDKEKQNKEKLSKGFYYYKGTAGKINNELAKIDFPATQYQEVMDAAKNISPDDYKQAALLKWKQSKTKLLQSFTDKKISAATQKIALANHDIILAAEMLDYAGYRKQEERMSANKIAPTPVSYFDFVNNLNLNDKALFTSGSFSTFINRLEYSDPIGEYYRLVNQSLPLAEQEISGDAILDSLFYTFAPQKNNLVLQTIHLRASPSKLRYVFKGGADDYVTYKMKKFAEPFFQKEFSRIDMIDKKRKNNIGTNLPDTRAGQIFKSIIAKYKGKRLYVDFWATTCAPCIANIKKQYTLRENFANNPDFDFVFITPEDQTPKEDYSKFVTEQKLTNTHYLNTSDFHYLRELFKFNGIPRYIIIDESGKLIDDDYQMHNFKWEIGKLYPKYEATANKLIEQELRNVQN